MSDFRRDNPSADIRSSKSAARNVRMQLVTFIITTPVTEAKTFQLRL